MYTGAKIDVIEDTEGHLTAFEIKSNKKIAKEPATWSENYPYAKFETINKDNWVAYVA